MSIVYLNGQFVPQAEARVSVMDRGFLFADGAYELVPVYSRRPFRLAEHLRRLQHTLDALRIPNPRTDAEWTDLIHDLVARNAPDDQSIYLQVTRGADVRRDHAFPQVVQPTVFMLSSPLVTPGAEVRARGIAARTASDIRWLRCDLKTLALLANCLLKQEGLDAGCAETILLRDGFLSEGTASNIFVVRQGRLLTPPKSHLMLAGITYDVVLELAARHGMPHEVREIAERELRTADELWMTSSTREVLAITSLDGQPVGDGRPGPMAAQMYDWYQTFKNEVMRRGH